MMDHRKEATLLKFISVLWHHDVFKISELKDFSFFLDILKLLNSEQSYSDNIIERKLIIVQEFLQEYFIGQSDVRNFIDFEKIQNYDMHWDADIELAKITVVLIAVGIVSESQDYFISCAMKLPEAMHSDLISLILSCMKADSPKVVLTHAIEKTLLQRSDEQEKYNQSSHVGSLCQYHKGSPLSKASYKLKYNRDVILTPFHNNRSSNFSVHSPFKDIDLLIESPVISSYQGEDNQKELLKIKQQLNDEICLRDELQFHLKELQSEVASNAVEIFKLQERIKELLHLESAFDELQEVKIKLSEAEVNIVKQQKATEKFKTLFQDRIEEIWLKQLKTEMKSEEKWKSKVNELEEMIKLKNSKIRFLEEENLQLKTGSNEDHLRECFEEMLVMNRSLREHLQSTSDEQYDVPDLKCMSECGVPIYFDIQLAELKEELNNAREEKCALQEELGLLKADNKKLKEKLDSLSVDGNKQRATMLHSLWIKDHYMKKIKKILQKLRAEVRSSERRTKLHEGALYEIKTDLFVREKHAISNWAALKLNQSPHCFSDGKLTLTEQSAKRLHDMPTDCYDSELMAKNDTLEIEADFKKLCAECHKVHKSCNLKTEEKRLNERKSELKNVSRFSFVKSHQGVSNDCYHSNPKSANLFCLNESFRIKENKSNREESPNQKANLLDYIVETPINGALCMTDKVKLSPCTTEQNDYAGPSENIAKLLNCIYPDLAVDCLEHPLAKPGFTQCCAEKDFIVSSPMRSIQPYQDQHRGTVKKKDHSAVIIASYQDYARGLVKPTLDHPLKSFNDTNMTERERCLQKEIKLETCLTNKTEYIQVSPSEDLCKVPVKKEVLLYRLLKKALAQLKNLSKLGMGKVQKNNVCFELEPILNAVIVNDNNQIFNAKLKRTSQPEVLHPNFHHADADIGIDLCHTLPALYPCDFVHHDTACDIKDGDSSVMLSDLSRPNAVSSLKIYTDNIRSDGQEERSLPQDISFQIHALKVQSKCNRLDGKKETFKHRDNEACACQMRESKFLNKQVSCGENSVIKGSDYLSYEVNLLPEAHRETKSLISSDLPNRIDICKECERLEHNKKKSTNHHAAPLILQQDGFLIWPHWLLCFTGGWQP